MSGAELELRKLDGMMAVRARFFLSSDVILGFYCSVAMQPSLTLSQGLLLQHPDVVAPRVKKFDWIEPLSTLTT